MNIDEVWRAVKEIKVLKYDGSISSKVDALAQKLEVESSKQRFENISKGVLKTASEMYLYLDTIMKRGQSLNWTWLQFYFNLFQTKSATEIILSLNRIFKSKGRHH